MPLPGWLARRGIAQHLVNEAHAFAYSGRYGEARELLEPAAERALATERDGARGSGWKWRSPRSPETPAGRGRRSVGSPPSPRRHPRSGQDAALVWAHVGVAQGHLLLGECGPAAVALAAGRRSGRQPGGDVVHHP